LTRFQLPDLRPLITGRVLPDWRSRDNRTSHDDRPQVLLSSCDVTQGFDLECWLRAHSVAATLGAAILTALATAVLAFLTWRAVSAATTTVDEIRRDRELRQRPHLRWGIGGGAWVDGSNYGVGSAINCIFCTSEPHLWRRTDLADVSPNQEIKGPSPPAKANADLPLKPQAAADAPGHGVTDGHGMIAFCEDGAGNRYRFRDRFVTPDVWRPGEPRPEWVDWYEIQAGYPPEDA
jgi:hypothetical protein